MAKTTKQMQADEVEANKLRAKSKQRIRVRVGQQMLQSDFDMTGTSMPAPLVATGRYETVFRSKPVQYLDRAHGPNKGETISWGVPLDVLMKIVGDFRTKYGAEYTDLCLVSESCTECRDSCTCDPSWVLVGERLETDQELADRLANEAKYAKYESELKLKQLAQLAAQLGKTVQ